jgi:sigma-B regulation protein RsbU (phosphoserine phosphatase)
MTAVPIPSQPPPVTPSTVTGLATETTPVLALKELVASLYREQNKVQNLLSSLGFALRSFNNLNQFLELTPLMAARMTDADGSALILFNANGQAALEQIHCHDPQLRQVLQQAIAQLDTTSSTSNGSPTTSSISARLDGQIRHSLGATARLHSTPILVKNVERGRLYIFSRYPDYVWTQTRRKLLQLVADQTAVAIANSELTIELRAKERQDRELEIASDIQLRLLPRQCPKIRGLELAARCCPADRVGGDYYDFIPSNYDQLQQTEQRDADYSDSRVPWSIAIGDVMGKGVPAGLIMTMTRGMLRAEVLNLHSPAQILQHLNRVMYADLDQSHRFVTLFYSQYDPETQILSYSNAAHNPPLLWQAATQSVQRLDAEGMLIGLDLESQYQDAQVQLVPGDILIYYTDGFTEAANAKGDRFEETNLLDAFTAACQQFSTPQAILDYLFDQVQQFVGAGNNRRDDMTLIVMQVKSTE